MMHGTSPRIIPSRAHLARAPLCAALAASLALAPALVRAQGVVGVAAFAPAGSIQEVRRLYEEGRARFETMDYAGAVELWTKAYAMVEANEENREIRNNLAYNIAAAKEKQFELEGDVKYLKQARGLLQRYVDEYKALYKPTPEAREEIGKVEEKIAALDAKIAEAEKSAPAAAAPVVDDRAARREEARAKKAKYRELIAADPNYGAAKGMIGGGAAMLGVGVATSIVGLAVAGAGGGTAVLGTTDADRQRAQRLRIAGWVTFGLGLGLAGGGAALLGIGLTKRKKAVLENKKKAGLVRLAPQVDPISGNYGLVLSGRF